MGKEQVNAIWGICVCDVEMYTLARCGVDRVNLPCSGSDQLITTQLGLWVGSWMNGWVSSVRSGSHFPMVELEMNPLNRARRERHRPFCLLLARFFVEARL